ncbi:ABC-F family ATP-binding cassette domain-containing protein [Knoellia subterranea]|uniref:Antibiotic ABC transporter ATP-binding protein n=1 Tax=Knoellia subterranea KCTC 19937 TaxID=1385521 RepID=A0A0A0JL56_9MICO|nr:ABC-F family ATP-binding cassette domain-containing protein [Knoellia subterranea]KGN36371.1 antibiotic ABC transporter ATP-binding protein [Knoellia subterranea KCTC 19937]
MTHPTALTLRDVTHTYDGRTILDGVDLTVAPGQRVGLIGENGAGKSTLIRLVAGLEEPTHGTITTPQDLGYLAQDSGLDPRDTVGDVLTKALAPLHDAVAHLEKLAHDLTNPVAAQAYDDLLTWATHHDAWDADRRATLSAQRLGLAELDRDTRIAQLSGGQRSRLALAALLTRRPECLVLDEPTNHLDDAALDHLESELVQLPGALLVASHDRVFLDRVCTAVVDLDPSHFGTDGEGGRRFSGDYTAYREFRLESQRRWEEAYAVQQAELADLRSAARTSTSDVAHNRGPRDNDKFIHAFKGARVQKSATRRAKDAQQRIEVLEREQVPKPRPPLRFTGRFASNGRGAGSVRVRDLVVQGRVRVPRFDVAAGEHVLIEGANGSGKSTLLHVLAGRLAPDAGDVQVSARRIGLLGQDVDFVDPARTVRETYRATGSEVLLGELGLVHPRDVDRPVGLLSEGQQRRLALAIVIGEQPDLLLLDEPTNHLSLALVEEVEEALVRTPVTVVVASHDRWLRERWTGPRHAIG